MNTRWAIHSMSSPTVAARAGSPDIDARSAKNCIIRPPPIQITAIEMCRKRRNVYQVIDSS